MEKEVLKFKTNVNCEHCLAHVKPFLDKVKGIDSWKIDLDDPDKILIVRPKGAKVEQIVDAVEQAGYDITEQS